MGTGTALITGASGGIGYELAKLLARKCNRLVLVARSAGTLNRLREELERTGDVDILVIPKDLSAKTSPLEIYQELAAKNITVDVLINNAGFGDHNALVDADWTKLADMLAVNITALTHLTRLFAKGMVERRNGKILNVSSSAAFQPGPFMAVYYASKAYVLSFTEALAEELRGTGVTVTALCPGPTATGFARTAGAERSLLFRFKKPAAAVDVARYGYKAMLRGRTVAVHGMLNKLIIWSIRFSPRAIPPMIVRRLHKTV
jgi:short-subunit dehydrogenase